MRFWKTLIKRISEQSLNGFGSFITRVLERRTSPSSRYVSQLANPAGHSSHCVQDFTPVLLDHILYVSSEQPPALTVVDTILPHFVELSTAYPVQSAEAFVKKLKVMQKNLSRGLQDPLNPSSKTFPGVPELILLRVLGGTWSTSDMKHAVVGPARYVMGAYLGLSRIRSIADIASGLFLCTLFYEASAVVFLRDGSLSGYSMSKIQSDSFRRLSTSSSTPCFYSLQPLSRTRRRYLVLSPPRILAPSIRKASGSRRRRPKICNPGNRPCSQSSTVTRTSK